MSAKGLVPERRRDKNGKAVTRWVKPTRAMKNVQPLMPLNISTEKKAGARNTGKQLPLPIVADTSIRPDAC